MHVYGAATAAGRSAETGSRWKECRARRSEAATYASGTGSATTVSQAKLPAWHACEPARPQTALSLWLRKQLTAATTRPQAATWAARSEHGAAGTSGVLPPATACCCPHFTAALA